MLLQPCQERGKAPERLEKLQWNPAFPRSARSGAWTLRGALRVGL